MESRGPAWWATLLGGVVTGTLAGPVSCRETTVRSEETVRSGSAPVPVGSVVRDPRGRAAVQPRADTRFVRIRNLLREDPDAPARAVELYGLVEPVCTDPAVRSDFLETAAWSASFSDRKARMTVVYALDTIEHVATSCARNHLEGALDLLRDAGRILPDEPRIFVMQARVLAAYGRFEAAERAARRAKNLGHVHAIALTAHIQARRAREGGVGYRPGMLDAAIDTVRAEPTTAWALIDLEAVLVTRARLLLERAVWEEAGAAEATEAEARVALRRLSVAPFEKNARRRALDALCFFAIRSGADPEGSCGRAAREMHNLGAARALGIALEPTMFEADRHRGLVTVGETLATLRREDTVIVVLRGDEAEILEWVRPAVRVLARIATTRARLVMVDRSSSPRAAALADRVVALAGLEPELRLVVGRDTLAMPCIAATVANRRTPPGCPIDRRSLDRLERLQQPKLSLLIGRDLDAEIDDLKLYALPSVLLSLRRSRHEKVLLGWLKSQSDAFVVVPPETDGSRWLRIAAP